MTAGEGINFRVIDVDTFSRNEIVGRCFCPATVMQQAMKNNSPIVMSLGDGCAEIAFHSFRNHIERAQLHTATRLHYRPMHNLAEAVSHCACANSVGKLKVLVHGPLKSRSGMLMNNDAGMLEEKGSRNEQTLATSRTRAATVPTSSKSEAKQEAKAKVAAEAKTKQAEAKAKVEAEAKVKAEAKAEAKAKKAAAAKLFAEAKQAAGVLEDGKKLVKA